MKWKEKLVKIIDNQLDKNVQLQAFYRSRNINPAQIGVHLAIFTEPFLSLLLSGEKSVESRFSINRVPPFGRVGEGDIVVVKKSGGNVIGYFLVGKAEYFAAPNDTKLAKIKKTFSTAIGSHWVHNFWESRYHAKHISLFDIQLMTELNPLKIDKKDRTAWSIMRQNPNLNFDELWKK